MIKTLEYVKGKLEAELEELAKINIDEKYGHQILMVNILLDCVQDKINSCFLDEEGF